MPKAFTGHTGMIQRNAIRSWARFDPAPEILLFGEEPGVREMADEVGARHIPVVDRNEFGTPLVDRLFQAAQDHASHEVLAYVNADMILFQDFVQAVQEVQMQLPSFLLIGQRWDLPLLDEIDFSELRWRESLARRVQEHAMLHAECGLDYFVFRKGLWPQIPPFAIGRTAWDNWLVMDPHKRGIPVVDGTEFVAAVHQDHDYGHVAGGRHEAWNGMEAARNRSLAGPADPSGLTTGATWLLREDGTLAQTRPRRPRYVSVAYRDERSAWLLDQARKLTAAGAQGLAACKCEEALTCLDGWLELVRLGCMASESVNHADIADRYVAGHALLAQCYMQMGRYEQVVAAYTRLLQNPRVQIAPAQRDSIAQVRDRLARRLERTELPASPSIGCTGSETARSEHSESSAASCPSPAMGSGNAADHRPRVTVVTACRNGQRYLKECVDSILSQTMADWELFLIDDGSTDDTRRMMEEYARQDARIHSHHFLDSRGPYARRNFAISRAASDFIVIQDADDIMSPTKLERLCHEINRDNCLAIVGSNHRTFLDEFRGLEHTEPSELPADHDTIVASCVSWRAAISHGTAIIRKALFDTIGPYDENPFASDAFWSAKLALYAQIGAPVKMANVPEYLTLIRIHPSSQTQILPVFDPRGRRVRYRHYCECKLRRVREKWRQQAPLDIALELRNCNCSDFLVRFKAKIVEWESEPLPARFVNDLLTGALSSFREKAYVSCMIILNGLDVMQRDVARRVKGFDLLKGMALYASGLSERGFERLQREIANHDNPLARQLLRDSQEQGASMDVPDWCRQNAPGLELRLAGEERERVRVAML
jgi:glycosyltransferase involved in cell wall biosynthesis